MRRDYLATAKPQDALRDIARRPDRGSRTLLLVGSLPGMTLPTDPRDDQARIPQQPTPTQPQPVEPATAPARPAVRRWTRIAAAAVVVVAVAVGIAYELMADGDDAVDYCQTAISGQLKSPATAKYADGVTVTEEEGNFGTYYEVSGEVDAENGFGALVRGDYRCKVTRERGGGWLVTESSFTQR